jgi:hypothetical protein
MILFCSTIVHICLCYTLPTCLVYRFFGYSWPGDHKDKTQYIILFGVHCAGMDRYQNKTGESVWPIMQYSYQYPSDAPYPSALFKISSYFVYRRGTDRNVFQINMLLEQTLFEHIPVKINFLYWKRQV